MEITMKTLIFAAAVTVSIVTTMAPAFAGTGWSPARRYDVDQVPIYNPAPADQTSDYRASQYGRPADTVWPRRERY
jgi:hypothetical protein